MCAFWFENGSGIGFVPSGFVSQLLSLLGELLANGRVFLCIEGLGKSKSDGTLIGVMGTMGSMRSLESFFISEFIWVVFVCRRRCTGLSGETLRMFLHDFIILSARDNTSLTGASVANSTISPSVFLFPLVISHEHLVGSGIAGSGRTRNMASEASTGDCPWENFPQNITRFALFAAASSITAVSRIFCFDTLIAWLATAVSGCTEVRRDSR